MTTQGIFCWHDLGTTDVERAKAFYSELLGWKVGEQMAEAPYWVFEDGHNQTGGMMQLPADSPHPSHWMPYVTVMDCDAAAAQVVELGGQVAVGPLDIPTVGRFAVVSDDQGAWISIISMPVEAKALDTYPRPGQFCWYALATKDVEKAKAFYGALVGWTSTTYGTGEEAQEIFMQGKVQTAGTRVLTDGSPPRWELTVCVAEVDAACARAEALGGQQLGPIRQVGTFGRAGVIQDPTGAVIALFEAA